MSPSTRRAGALLLLLLAGFLAGAQLGKIAPLTHWLGEARGLSLTLIGWLTAAIGLFVALVALPVGLAVDRFGALASFWAATAMLVVGGLGVALFAAPAWLMAARLVEGGGYLVLVVTIPAMLNAVAPPAWRPAALALWGGFVPIGFAIADFVALAVLPVAGPPVYLAVLSAGFALAALAAGLLLRGLDGTGRAMAGQAGAGLAGVAASASGPVVAVALAFGLFVVLSMGFLAFLPAYAPVAADRLLLTPGVVALVVPVGNLMTGAAMRGRGLRLAGLLTVAGFVAMAAAAWPLYAGGTALEVTGGAVLFAFASGIASSALFAAIPFIVPAAGSAAVVIGLVAQAGGVATIAGPPLSGFVIESYGWTVFAAFLVVVALAGLIAAAPLTRRR